MAVSMCLHGGSAFVVFAALRTDCATGGALLPAEAPRGIHFSIVVLSIVAGERRAERERIRLISSLDLGRSAAADPTALILGLKDRWASAGLAMQ
jgi:hypothetical protein